ncbi:MAG: aspartate 1-decarboxylase [Moorea sp. SIO2B7]|nr:aspartate 1-decarboxylase [Moorena sp. SIO2B7]
METIRLMHAKLHRVRVTEANLEYMGSITIDADLIEKVGILPLQEVQIVNVTNGNRLSTYVFPGEAGTGRICINGAAAHLCDPGDIVIIIAYEERDRTDVLRNGHQAKVLVADENNRCQQFFFQNVRPYQNKIEFSSSQPVNSQSDFVTLNYSATQLTNENCSI